MPPKWKHSNPACAPTPTTGNLIKIHDGLDYTWYIIKIAHPARPHPPFTPFNLPSLPNAPSSLVVCVCVWRGDKTTISFAQTLLGMYVCVCVNVWSIWGRVCLFRWNRNSACGLALWRETVCWDKVERMEGKPTIHTIYSSHFSHAPTVPILPQAGRKNYPTSKNYRSAPAHISR